MGSTAPKHKAISWLRSSSLPCAAPAVSAASLARVFVDMTSGMTCTVATYRNVPPENSSAWMHDRG